MAFSNWSCTSQSITIAIVETLTRLEKELKSQNIFIECERMQCDKQWLSNILKAKPGIQFIRVVKCKPEGGIFVKRRHYFDAYLVKRNIPYTQKKVWWMYLLPIQK